MVTGKGSNRQISFNMHCPMVYIFRHHQLQSHSAPRPGDSEHIQRLEKRLKAPQRFLASPGNVDECLAILGNKSVAVPMMQCRICFPVFVPLGVQSKPNKKHMRSRQVIFLLPENAHFLSYIIVS